MGGQWVCRGLLLVSMGAGGSSHPHPALSLKRPLRNPGLGARKTPHRIPAGTPASASPPGEGEEGRRLDQIDIAHSSLGSCQDLPGERALRNSGLGARKTPHRLPPGTAASASPPGEGEEGRPPLIGLALCTRPWVTQRSPRRKESFELAGDVAEGFVAEGGVFGVGLGEGGHGESQGLTRWMSIPWKSRTLRVAMAKPCALAVPAMRASPTSTVRPTWRACARRSAAQRAPD